MAQQAEVSQDALELPTLPELVSGLRQALAGTGAACDVIDRQPLEHASTFASEILTCMINGRPVRILGKYGGMVAGHADHGSRGCVPYEAKVYQALLPALGVTAPRCLAAWAHPATGHGWLFLEYLEGSQQVQKLPEDDGMGAAAQWAGRFHAAGAMGTAPAWVIRYDEAFYRGWVDRTLAHAGEWRRQLPWLEPLCRRAMESLRVLLDEPTLIHGEFYPRNVLAQGGIIYPVDWESAAIGAGEIDLAALTEGWPDETVRACRARYCRARWPQGAPAEAFERRFAAARLYNAFRWLGARPEWAAYPRARGRFDELRAAGQRTGLVPA